MRRFILFICLIISSCVLAAPTIDFKDFKNIVLDMRGSRGGNGDVSAGYLVAGQLIKDKGVKRLTLIVDKETMGILSTLVGTQVKDRDILFDGAAEVRVYEKITEPFRAVDLLFQFAKKNSQENLANTIYRPSDPDSSKRSKIHLTPDAFWITHTVLGNSEFKKEEAANFGEIRHGPNNYYISSPGLRDWENGVYSDNVAKKLSGKTEKEVLAEAETSLQKEKAMNSGDPKRLAELRVLESTLFEQARGKILKGSEQGFAYGLMSTFQKTDFEAYLEGLKNAAQKLGKAFVVFSPVKYESVYDIPGLKRREFPQIENVEYLNLSEEPFDLSRLPKNAEAGKVYFVTIPKLSNAMFNQFLYRSKPIPVIAGDGALSAAINMEKAFLMTVVPWNEHNVESVHLQKSDQTRPESEARALVDQSFDPSGFYKKEKSERLKVIEDLETNPKSKAEYSHPLKAHDLLGRTQEQLSEIVSAEAGTLDFEKVSDSYLKTSFLAREARKGNEAATKKLVEIIPQDPYDFLQFYEIWKLYSPFDKGKAPPLEKIWLKKIATYFKNKLKQTPFFSEILKSAMETNPHNSALWKMITDALYDRVDAHAMGDRNEINVSGALKEALEKSPHLKDIAYVHLKPYLNLIQNGDSKGSSLFKMLSGQKDFNNFLVHLYENKKNDPILMRFLRHQMILARTEIPEQIWKGEIKAFLKNPDKDWGYDWHLSPLNLLKSAFRWNPLWVLESQDKDVQKAYRLIFSDSKNDESYFDTGWGEFWEKLLKTRKKSEKEILLAGKEKPFLRGFYRILGKVADHKFSSFKDSRLSCVKLLRMLVKYRSAHQKRI